MDNITDIDLYNAARDAGVLIVTQAEEDAAIKFGRAVLALRMAPAALQPVRDPLHVTVLIDWLHARFKAAGGKEGITDVAAWSEEVMRWTEAQHGIGSKA